MTKSNGLGLFLLALVLLSPYSLRAEEESGTADTQVEWQKDWETAFRKAKESKRPVMVCINSKDGEGANERTAKTIYKDPEFVKLSRKFVMLVVSVRHHNGVGPCRRFGIVTCAQHKDCYQSLRNKHGAKFFVKGTAEMVSPQHAWFSAEGTLLSRKEYELSKAALLKRMKSALAEATGAPPPPDPNDPDAGNPDAPLNDRDRAELERVRKGAKEARYAAAQNLVATGKKAAIQGLIEVATKAKPEVVQAVLRAFGGATGDPARLFVEAQLKHKDALTRSFAAVALETLLAKESIPILIDRAKKERDTAARRNIYRALGACGGAHADKKAGQTLLKRLKDKQKAVAKYAALGLSRFESEAASKLVLPALEKFVLRVKDDALRGAIVYALATIGNKTTTVKVLEKLKKDVRAEYRVRFIQGAIDSLLGRSSQARDGMGRSLRWLFGESRNDPARAD